MIAKPIAFSIPAFERFGQLMMKVAGTKRDETEKKRNLLPLTPIFLRFSDFQQMGNRCISRAIAGLLMAEAVPKQRFCRFTVP